MGRAQNQQRRVIPVAQQRATLNTTPNVAFAQNVETQDSATNIAGNVAPWVYPPSAPIGGGIEDYRSPKRNQAPDS